MRDAHLQLDKQVQRWLFNQGWYGLREIQCKAVAPILSAQTDVLISASTASGKTEAFFLPACSALMAQSNIYQSHKEKHQGGYEERHEKSNKHSGSGVGILYISPLKALINDQYRRLQSLADLLDLQVTPWHGDSAKSGKIKQKKSPSGIILITPESLESLLIRDASWVKQAFANLQYIVIDEFHAFLGDERGQHLLSLLTRLEHIAGRLDDPIPRVALSATLGDLANVPQSLRPNHSLPCEIIEESEAFSSIKIQLKGYIEPSQMFGESLELANSAEMKICADLYRFCRGGSHLVFANSRKRTEMIATELSELCEKNVVPNEFFPHHGSLSKELREGLEQRLQKESLPTTAICTMTLELGIDIGKVDSVIQVTAPHSVSSLRQRLGRSGRRGGSSILRMLITERQLDKNSNLIDGLRLELLQSLAMVRLLIANKWFEPADTSLYHFSTLLHQVLATIAQWGGIRADQLYGLLCKQGIFQKITPAHFKSLLKQMGEDELITQLGSGELVLGVLGERLVGHYTFYAVFETPEEYRVVAGNKTLGTLPVESMILPKQHIIFGGKRWQVLSVDSDKKVIDVVAIKGGGKPPAFGGGGMSIHDRVRQEMLAILVNGDYRIAVGAQKVDFIDATARHLFTESLETFERCHLDSQAVVVQDGRVYILTWLGDKVVNTLLALLITHEFDAESYAGVICVSGATYQQVIEFLQQLAQNPLPTATEIAKLIPNKRVQKFDQYLPEDLLCIGYGAQAFDVQQLSDWLRQFTEKSDIKF
ncbi:DEAD/DEAH box helicase [Psychrobacter sp. I-STPA10]|uniref:DEAD/DEAH box helicase n=1 Tax=Psychrobacter sp. I-STPA10 TaxID=2585769 RepID=UPI001E552549|nr:DEAD/DEAH box helicase [Psychrobacter sp. I-STPA10]